MNSQHMQERHYTRAFRCELYWCTVRGRTAGRCKVRPTVRGNKWISSLHQLHLKICPCDRTYKQEQTVWCRCRTSLLKFGVSAMCHILHRFCHSFCQRHGHWNMSIFNEEINELGDHGRQTGWLRYDQGCMLLKFWRQWQYRIGKLSTQRTPILPPIDSEVLMPLLTAQGRQVWFQAAQVQVMTTSLHVNATFPTDIHR